MKQAMRQLQIPAQAVIGDFCWGYANALLQKLKALKKEERIPQDYRDDKLVERVIDDLTHQVGKPTGEVDEKFIEAFIAYAEEYLAIFEKKK